ncbi:zinc finger protein 652-like isoform X2 [Ceratina calcarata]|uniref:Zinc finger protein 652-like isoform X2 n=1 Tax=Ceratina calcarata TaxID=156304 RepID=A0AAJ7S2Y0_9HYME|nr:zinc finger protein 652-like isoform X2 [Ceratina calcarata]
MKASSFDLLSDENGTETCDKISDDQDTDEETIATFVTATGQQLALYAVEDLEEIFAVAVYDESGDPPTDFQFLLKSDVERLIGEGAVKTVKKPTQIRRQLLTTQSPIFFAKNEVAKNMVHNGNKYISSEKKRIGGKENILEENSSAIQNCDLNLATRRVPKIICAADETPSNVTCLMMDDCSGNFDNSEECQQSSESDGEFVEQSTVQYILYDGDQSDSELTFDEVHETLQNLKSNLANKQVNEIVDKEEQGDSVNETESTYKVSEAAVKKRSNSSDRRELIRTLEDSPADVTSNSTNLDISNGSIVYTSPESSQIQYKTKRSRKQQLISVNRDDSEIIIQPASLITDEDNKNKKKKRTRKFGYRSKNSATKKMKKMKRKEVEVIEIDVDEGESILESRRDIVEITIDDNKEKYSSDKENEIIMVGDSDEESQQSNSKTVMLQCQHCTRNFRQQRALETHLRVCSKSSSSTNRFNEQKGEDEMEEEGQEEEVVKKMFSCKICEEKFDVALALARHVRFIHLMKKGEDSKSSVERPPVKKQSTMVRKVKRKRSQRSSCTLEKKKLWCSDCGRWLPSVALLRAHCLQHAIKKSEKQIRRCQICKKHISSRIRFVQHLQKHAASQTNAIPISNIQKKLRTTRSMTSRIATLRKRGRSSQNFDLYKY